MKKNILFAACAWLLCQGHAIADEFVINDITIPQGGTADLTVGFSFTSTTTKVGFTFALGLPEGISLVKDADGDPVYEKDETSIAKLDIKTAGEGNFAGQPSNENAIIKGTSGTLLTLHFSADASLAVGSILVVDVTKATFQQKVEGSTTDINIPDFTFTVTIGAPADSRTTFDENSDNGDVLKAATGVDVRVKRTIKADQWSTICLPFAMTSEQVVSAFGSEVELGDFNGIETTYEDENETIVSGIKVKFNTVTAIEANHPYIIRVGTPVSTFTVDNVDIIVEETPSVDKDEYSYQVQVGKNKYETRYMYNSFVGTYVAETEIPEKCLFLSDNQFWYSTGQTKSKGFRAYFDFYEWLPEAELSSSRVQMIFDESEATGISGVKHESNDDRYYNLNGQRVESPKKGLYIKNNRKVVVK